MFSSKDSSWKNGFMEVKKADQPKLFELIENVATAVGTAKPKKVYFSHQVNASVFYDSNLLSLLFPSRKNLHIGLGLVNSVTEKELEAILAHEFGHFSQNSMRIGSYLENGNHIVHDLLFNNESYGSAAQGMAQVHFIVYIFVVIALKVNEFIQFILRQLYKLMNAAYLGLSREMEFHSDEIAAHLTGSKPIADSLLRMDLSQFAMQTVQNYYDEKVAEKQYTIDINKDHRDAFLILAKHNDLEMKDGLPVVTVDSKNRYNRSKLKIDHTWSSHPTDEERIERVESLGLKEIYGSNGGLASYLINEIEGVQKRLSTRLFDNLKKGKDAWEVDDSFISKLKDSLDESLFPACFNEYYDYNDPVYKDKEHVKVSCNPHELFSRIMLEESLRLNALSTDMQMIAQIDDGSLGVKHFIYDGKKYKKKEAKTLLENLSSEGNALNERMLNHNQEIYSFFSNLDSTTQMTDLYQDYNNYAAYGNEQLEVPMKIQEELSFINSVTDIDTITRNLNAIGVRESRFRKIIKELLESENVEHLSEGDRKKLEIYISKTWQYFGYDSYRDLNLQVLFNALEIYTQTIHNIMFKKKKALLSYQAELYRSIK